MLTAELTGQRIDETEVPRDNPGAALSPAEEQEVVERSLSLLRSTEYLARLNRTLEGAERPLPAVGVSLHVVPDTDLPGAFIAYGKTIPGEGLRPVTNVTLDGRGGRKVWHGLALPVSQIDRKAVEFFPHEGSPGSETQRPSRVTGYWQQWQKDTLTVHKPNREPSNIECLEYDLVDDSSFSTWHVPLALAHPFMIDDAVFAQDEANRVMRVVREMPGPWRDIYNESRQLNQSFVAVGQATVRAALRTLQEPSGGSSKLPQPFSDMLSAVMDDLQLVAG